MHAFVNRPQIPEYVFTVCIAAGIHIIIYIHTRACWLADTPEYVHIYVQRTRALLHAWQNWCMHAVVRRHHANCHACIYWARKNTN